jgi:hypothetical protein
VRCDAEPITLILPFRPLHLVAPWQPGRDRRAACAPSCMIRSNLYLKTLKESKMLSYLPSSASVDPMEQDSTLPPGIICRYVSSDV